MSVRIVISAFACDPSKGSEPGNGWNFAYGLAKRDYEVHCFTRNIGRQSIEKEDKPSNLHFHYVVLPYGLENLYSRGGSFIYLYYLIWQWMAAAKARAMHRKFPFSFVHHITWGSLQLGSFMYKLKIPFIFGPAGGGQSAPIAFREYFKEYWNLEMKREKISRFLQKYNPAFRKMITRASTVIVSNPDTAEIAREAGSRNVIQMLDACLPESFFPSQLPNRPAFPDRLKLLWVGRMMPRKGVLLVLDVMRTLKNEPGITLTVVGDGKEMKDHFTRKLKEYNLEGTVNWVGAVPFEQVKAYYASHDAFFFTSLRDSGAVQLLEAMAYGLPVITLDLHGQSVIVNEQTGIKASLHSPAEAIDQLRAAILRLKTDPELRLTKSRAAFEFARTQTWKQKISLIIAECYPCMPDGKKVMGDGPKLSVV